MYIHLLTLCLTNSLFFFYVFKKTKFDIATIINGILGSLVSITGQCLLL